MANSTGVEISSDGTMMRTKHMPEKWPIGTQLKADAPEFVPRTESDTKRPGRCDVTRVSFGLSK